MSKKIGDRKQGDYEAVQAAASLRLSNVNVVTPTGLRLTAVSARGGRLALDAHPGPAEREMDGGGLYLLPGFIDPHFHGCSLFDFTVGSYDPQTASFDDSAAAYEQGLTTLTQACAAQGVTSLYGGTFAASVETLGNCCRQLAQWMAQRPGPPSTGARMIGALLEGSFINADLAGAQNPDFVFEPALERFESIQGHEVIRLANVVPDYGSASLRLIEALTERGVVVGAGHTDATAMQINDAVKAGLKYCIHFTNGPTGSSFKPFDGGGAVEGVLANDAIYAELIPDGFHVNPAYILDIIRRKGVERIMAVTDANFLAGSDIKEFELGGVRGHANDEGTCLFVSGKHNILFGSCLTMRRGFENLLNWLTVDHPGVWYPRHPARPLDEALMDLTLMYSGNTAAVTGVAEQGFGRIEDGAVADMVLLDIQGEPGRFNVDIAATIVDGCVVYER